MKGMLAILVLIVAGFILNYYYERGTEETDTVEEEIEVVQEEVYEEELPPIPENCGQASKAADNAMYGAATHTASFAQRNSAVRKFKFCLREAGFEEGQIDAMMEVKKEKIKRYLEMDGKG